MITQENLIRINLQKEYLLIYEDKLVISWLHDNADIIDTNTFPRKYKSGIIIRFAIAIIFYSLFYIYYVRNGFESNLSYYFMIFNVLPSIPLVDGIRLLTLSSTTEIPIDKIKEISTTVWGLTIRFDNNIGKEKLREVRLPRNKEKRETALQLLRENRLLDLYI